MRLSPLFGVAKMLVRSRKLKMAAVGLQLAYLGYTYYSEKKKINRCQNNLKNSVKYLIFN